MSQKSEPRSVLDEVREVTKMLVDMRDERDLLAAKLAEVEKALVNIHAALAVSSISYAADLTDEVIAKIRRNK